jgi:hypothetical protein
MPLTQVQNGMLAGVIPASLGGTGTTAGVTGFKNRIINGDMTIDQRNAGASVTANSGTSAYTLDRFGYNNQSGANFTIQQSSVAPAGFNRSMQLTVTSANSPSSSQFFRIFQGIEGFNFADLGFGTANAKTITISFWAFSNTAGTYGYALNNAAGSRAYAVSYTLAANTWTYVTASIPGDTSGTWPGATIDVAAYLSIGLGSGSNGEISAGSWQTVATYMNQPTGTNDLCATNGAILRITGVQLEVGSAATNFDVLSYGTELQLCQRYFTIYRGGVYGGVQIVSSTFAFPLSVPVPMRTQPTFATNMTDSRFAGAVSPNSNQWAMYVQNSGWNTYSGSIDTLSLNGPAANSTQYNIGTYGVTLNSFTGFLLGGNIFFSFSAEF